MNIIPTPKFIKEYDCVLDISELNIYIKEDDSRISAAVDVLCGEMEAVVGKRPSVSFGEFCSAGITVGWGENGEGYRLSVSDGRVTIDGDGPAGAFYALQTLRQMIMDKGVNIPFCEISDEPDFSYRGFYHDVTRGRVPTLKKLKEIADMLSFYKVNSLQLYVEDAFCFKELSGIATPDNALTADEIRELDRYCRERFIDLIPSMATFGHLFTLLQSDRYNHICELKGHKLSRNYWLERQWHHTVDVYHPETFEVISSMIDQYLPLFSSEYFNICCDETMDLCNGTNEGKE